MQDDDNKPEVDEAAQGEPQVDQVDEAADDSAEDEADDAGEDEAEDEAAED